MFTYSLLSEVPEVSAVVISPFLEFSECNDNAVRFNKPEAFSRVLLFLIFSMLSSLISVPKSVEEGLVQLCSAPCGELRLGACGCRPMMLTREC